MRVCASTYYWVRLNNRQALLPAAGIIETGRRNHQNVIFYPIYYIISMYELVYEKIQYHQND